MERSMHLKPFLQRGLVVPQGGGIYHFVNKKNGKGYIGQSINLRRRLTDSISQLIKGIYHNKIFQAAWDKYGGYEGFDLKILATANNKEELNRKEIHYVQRFNTRNNKEGYNIEDGGTEVNKRKYQKKQKLALQDRKRQVAVYNLDGQLICHFPTLTKCAQAHKLSVSTIYGNCIGESSRVGDFIFQYVIDGLIQTNIIPITWDKRNIAILLYDKSTGNFVKELENTNRAIQELQCTSTALSFCLEGINPTLKGFIVKRKWGESVPRTIQPYTLEFNREPRPSKGKVIAIDINDSSKILSFENAFDASKQILEIKNFKSKGSYQIIVRALNGQCKSAYGFYWKYQNPIVVGKFLSTKTFEGYSAAFRQYAATHSHCQLLHSYPLRFKVTFQGELDHRNWVADFGIFKHNGIKSLLDYWFDHTTLVAQDDPKLSFFITGHKEGVLALRILPAGGCERYAELVYKIINTIMMRDTEGRVSVQSVECFEHDKNSSIYCE